MVLWMAWPTNLVTSPLLARIEKQTRHISISFQMYCPLDRSNQSDGSQRRQVCWIYLSAFKVFVLSCALVFWPCIPYFCTCDSCFHGISFIPRVMASTQIMVRTGLSCRNRKWSTATKMHSSSFSSAPRWMMLSKVKVIWAKAEASTRWCQTLTVKLCLQVMFEFELLYVYSHCVRL